MRQIVLGISLCWVLTNCTQSEEICVFIPEGAPVEVQYVSLTDSFLTVSSKQDLVQLLDKHHVLRDHFFRRDQYPDDSVFVNELYNRFTNAHIDTLGMEVKRVFGNEEDLKNEFAEAFKNLKYYYPEIRMPKIETVTSGFENDLFVDIIGFIE
jgi:hypothetical protein